MAQKWLDAPALSAAQASLADRILVGDMSEAVGERDATMTLGELAAIIGQGVLVVEQAAHGLTVGTIVRHDGAGWVTASSASEATAIAAAIVAGAPDADTLYLRFGGLVEGLSGLTPGGRYYLQADGSLATTPGAVEVEVLLATSATSGALRTIGGGSSGGGGGNDYYDLQMGFVGIPDAGAVDMILAPRALTIAASDPGGVHVGVNPTATATIGVRRNGVSVGSLEVSTAGVASWSVGADITLATGDRITLVAPNPADATLADVIVAFRGLAA